MQHNTILMSLCAAMLLSGCGTTPTTTPVTTNTNLSEIEQNGLIDSPVMSLWNNAFNPNTMETKKGGYLQWLNEDTKDHTITITAPDSTKQTLAVPSGTIQGVTLPLTGTWIITLEGSVATGTITVSN